MKKLVTLAALLGIGTLAHAAPDSTVLKSGAFSRELNDTANTFWVTKNIVGSSVGSMNLLGDTTAKTRAKWYYSSNDYPGQYKGVFLNDASLQVTFNNLLQDGNLNYGNFNFKWFSDHRGESVINNPFGYNVKSDSLHNVTYTPQLADTMYSVLVDISKNPVVTMVAKSDKKVNIRLDVIDANGRLANVVAPHHWLEGDNQWHTLEFRWDYIGLDPSSPNYRYYNDNTGDYNVAVAADGWSGAFLSSQNGRNNASQAFLFGRTAERGGIVLDLAKIVGIAITFDDGPYATKFNLDKSKTVTIKQITVGDSGGGDPNNNDFVSFTNIYSEDLKNYIAFLSSYSFGDYDNDGDDDLLAALNAKSGEDPLKLLIQRNNTFELKSISDVLTTSETPLTNRHVQWGDFNNDKKLDFICSGLENGVPKVKIYIQTDLGFTPTETGINYEGRLDWKDFDNDGDLDILINSSLPSSSSSVPKIFENKNQKYVDLNVDFPNIPGGSVAWGDYDNDGDLDALISGQNADPLNYYMKLYRNTNSSFSLVSTNFLECRADFISWIDFDKDGSLDVFFSGFYHSNQPVTRIYKNTQNDSFVEINTPFKELGGGYVADFNKDTYQDVIITGYKGYYNGFTWDTTKQSSIYLNDTRGGFIKSEIRNPNNYGFGFPCDFNRDGYADLLWFSSSLELYMNSFAPSVPFIKRMKSDTTLAQYEVCNINSAFQISNVSDVIYRSVNPLIASVSDAGIVSALKTGSTTIIVYDRSNQAIKDSIVVTIIKKSTVSFVLPRLVLFEKDTIHLSQLIKSQSQVDYNLYSSYHSNVAVITGDILVGQKYGTMKIYVVDKANSENKDSTSILVLPNIIIVGVQLDGSGSQIEVFVNGNAQLYPGIEKDFIISALDKTKAGNDVAVTRVLKSADRPNVFLLQLAKPVSKTQTITVNYAPQTAVSTDVKVRTSYTVKTTETEDNQSVEVRMYPNPATQSVTITATDLQSVLIYNAHGELINSISCNDSSLTLDVSGFANGLYFIQLKTETVSIKKSLLKQ